ncbi:MAG: 2-C-methyl-D-erythritol 4-phosphate cytidylyltransferase [Eubacteriales bacterium]|nr:2-C-methyl-D-erythritol 4-phosphate cytidylyltransferase [Eubacteriales bacterium]
MSEMNQEREQKACTAILLAAGSGLRMGTEIRKQYIRIAGIPMFIYSLRAMQMCPFITDILLMVPEEDLNSAEAAVREHASFEKVRGIRPGGAERYFTVALGLEDIDWPCDYVFIHDCARPLIDQDTLARLYETVRKTDACVAGVPSKDTVKIVDADCNVETTPVRANVWIVQTPQVFAFDLIRDAYRSVLAQEEKLRERGITLTDDAMVAELAGGCRVRMVQSAYRNIKITTPEDLVLAKAFLREAL